MKKIIGLVFLLTISSLVNANCTAAFRDCKDECGSFGFIFDYESGNLVRMQETNFLSNCVDSCQIGKRYCESKSSHSEACNEFKRKCEFECPSTLIKLHNGSILLLTNANLKCEEACFAGYRKCE